MKFSLFEKKYNYIGLHMNAHAIKALQFSFSGSRTAVKSYVNAPMPKGLMQNDDFIDTAKLSDFLKLSLERPQYGSFNTKRVVVSIPESKSFVRVIQIPTIDESKAEVAIMFEAEAYIPVPMDQVYFDWQILSQDDKSMEVLIVASPKEYVDRFMHIIEDAGLKLCGIEVEAQSVTRALVPPTVEEPVLIVDIDAEKTALIKVDKAVLEFTSSVPVAGNNFTDKISKELKITPADAEKLKREIGIANTVTYPNLKTVLVPIVQDLSSEVKNILKFHYDHSDVRIEKVLLTSGGAKLRHITEVLQPLLDIYAPIEVIVANPLEHVPHLEHSPLSPYEALSFTTAIGLALWERDIT